MFNFLKSLVKAQNPPFGLNLSLTNHARFANSLPRLLVVRACLARFPLHLLSRSQSFLQLTKGASSPSPSSPALEDLGGWGDIVWGSTSPSADPSKPQLLVRYDFLADRTTSLISRPIYSRQTDFHSVTYSFWGSRVRFLATIFYENHPTKIITTIHQVGIRRGKGILSDTAAPVAAQCKSLEELNEKSSRNRQLRSGWVRRSLGILMCV